MFPKVLIPLDGSRPAEAALIYAASFQTSPKHFMAFSHIIFGRRFSFKPLPSVQDVTGGATRNKINLFGPQL